MKGNYKGIHVPAGCDVLIGDDVNSLVSVGVLPEDGDTTVSVNYDSVEVKGNKNESIMRYVKNMTAEAKFSIYQLLLDNIARFSKGLMEIENIPGTPATFTQTIDAGWKAGDIVMLDYVNADGSAPVISEVFGSTSGAVSEGSGYQIVSINDRFGVLLNPASSASIAPVETITMKGTYTPAESKKVTMGAPSVEITPQVVRFKKEQGGKLFQITLWSATNEGGLTFGFPASSSDKPTTLDVTMKGGLDARRAEGDQLLEIIDEIGVY